MGLSLNFNPYKLHFKFEAGTSRGVLKEKECWIIRIQDSTQNKNATGLGEISTIKGLSFDADTDFEKELTILANKLSKESMPTSINEIYTLVRKNVNQAYPSIRFGLETALLDLFHGGKFQIYDNDFYKGKMNIPINGLIWMGNEKFMLEQISNKIQSGYRCLKMKIGAIDFEKECSILHAIRKEFKSDEMMLRVDANGAFSKQDVYEKLDALREFDLHSIEQPIKPKQTQLMKLICQHSKIPIALDEELIGVFDKKEKNELLDTIIPPYIILKPALLGGFPATHEWISLAESKNIGWWITSALESNIGLNAICQFTANYAVQSYQGLGTGQLFSNNIDSPLQIVGEEILYNIEKQWQSF